MNLSDISLDKSNIVMPVLLWKIIKNTCVSQLITDYQINVQTIRDKRVTILDRYTYNWLFQSTFRKLTFIHSIDKR